MANPKLPTSMRLQNKIMKDKFPDSQGKEDYFVLVFFASEQKYSVVEGRSIANPQNPEVNRMVWVKDGKGDTYSGLLIFKGDKEDCEKRQLKLESIISMDLDKEQSDEDKDKLVSKRKKTKGKGKKVDILSDEEDEDELTKEEQRVRDILKTVPSVVKENVKATDAMAARGLCSNELLKGVISRLDDVKDLLQQLVDKSALDHSFSRWVPASTLQKTPVSAKKLKLACIPESPTAISDKPETSSASDIESNQTEASEEFIHNGTNLLESVPCKAKKPYLYATALLSHLFTDEQMRYGCVEPKEGSKNNVLDQSKVDVIKKCIAVKYGEKVLDKCWNDIRISLNQKCLDKAKSWRKQQAGQSSSEIASD